MNPNSMSKYWCFTVNNPRRHYADLDGLKNWEYCIAGNEVGEEGTPHLQCFVVYKSRTRFTTVKAQLPKAHIEAMKTTPKKCIKYCKKDNDFEEFGTVPDFEGGATGGAKKAENFRAMIKLAMNDQVKDIMDIDPVSYVQHYHAFKRIRQDNPVVVKDLPDVCGEWIWGEPGTGKSFKARQENPGYYDKPLNKWWDGYRNEECIILDDVGIKQADWIGDLLKRWADRYSFPAEQKGTTVQIRPKKIIVTSNYKIEEIFRDATLCSAIQRRFKEIEFTVRDRKNYQEQEWEEVSISEEPEDSMLEEDSVEV